MDDVEDGMMLVRLPPGFPLEDIQEIAAELMDGGGIVPGYIPPDRGSLDLAVLHVARMMGESTVILPDRNIVTRVIAIAEGRARYPLDKPSQMAANLMAFCHCMDLNFDPSIAFHESGISDGNATANRELAWFRAADNASALAWVDVSRGRANALGIVAHGTETNYDFTMPLARWRRNYVAALKVTELELSDRTPLERARELLAWMVDDYFVAGPAAIFAAMYLSPMAPKKGLMKGLRSSNRERALAGVRNAAWDITYLSDFTRKVAAAGDSDRFILATADEALAKIARFLVQDTGKRSQEDELASLLDGWWPARNARLLAVDFANALEIAANRPPPAPTDPVLDLDPFTRWIAQGEKRIRDWAPSSAHGQPSYDT
jgi:hypothetical protein